MDYIPDIPRIYTAIAEWSACMVYVMTLKRRFRAVLHWALSAVFLAAFCVVQVVAGLLPLYLWIPGMIAAMITVYLCILSLCDINPFGAVFWAARAFVLAEFAAAFEWQFYYHLTLIAPAARHIVAEVLFMLISYALVNTAAFLLERRYAKSNTNLVIAPRSLITAIFIVALIFTISNISFINKNTPLSGTTASEIMYIRTLVDFCGVVLFYAQAEEQFLINAQCELVAMQNLINRQYEQYIASKENIEILNQRYHDLKHQIAVIKAEENADRRGAYLEELESGIKMFQAQNKTGNKILDILLFGKQMTCVQNNINFTCVADGTLLEFMDAMDLCSVVGNALENAIESVIKIDDIEKRLVKMAVFKRDNFLMLRFENYTENSLRIKDGLPLTTKDNIGSHGYGLKSIRAAAEKYGGNIRIGVENNWFTLCVLFPHKD